MATYINKNDSAVSVNLETGKVDSVTKKDPSDKSDESSKTKDNEKVVDKGSVSSLPKNVRKAYERYEKNGWGSEYPGKTKGTRAGEDYHNKPTELHTKDKNGNKVTYKEYDVNNKVNGKGRDAERFVRGSDGSVYYTDDHYKTFTKIK